MDHMEQAERLMSKAEVSLEEARDVLEKNNWDILDAMIELEKQGKTRQNHAQATTEGSRGEYRPVHATVSGEDGCNETKQGCGSFKKNCSSFKNRFRSLIRKSFDNSLVMFNKEGKEVIALPVFFAVIIMLCTFWIMIFVILTALLLGCRFSFRGRDLGTGSINRGMDKVQDAAAEFASKVKTAGTEMWNSGERTNKEGESESTNNNR